MDALGLKKRIAFGNKIRDFRNISPRTMRFFQFWKDKAAEMLRAGGKARTKAGEELEILDGAMQSRYDQLHPDTGILQLLLENFWAMTELKMRIQYGDYLGLAFRRLKGSEMSEMRSKVEQLDWQQTAQRLKEEEDRLEEELARRRTTLTPTPFLDDVKKAAAKLGCEADLVRYHIMKYAALNNFCHSGIEDMIDRGHFQRLAEAIIKDKKALKFMFQGRLGEQMEMRETIGLVEREWFEKLFVDEKSPRQTVVYIPTKKHLRKLKKLCGIEGGSTTSNRSSSPPLSTI